MEKIIKAAVERGASDLHIKAGDVFRARINGKLVALTKQRLTPDQTRAIAMKLISSDEDRARIERLRDFDCSWGMPGVGRFRVNVLRQRSSFMIVMRVVPFTVPTIVSLRLPEVLQGLAELDRGLVLVTGVSGSGKSSTVAAMVHHVNRTQHKHVVTIENPIEFLHRDLSCSITQREVGVDTESVVVGLRAALRQDPDVVVLGEMADAETIDTAIKGAETGHLVIATMPTADVVSTIERVIAALPAEEREVGRMRFAEALRAVVSQQLLPEKAQKARVPAVEVMVMTPATRDLIRDGGRTADILRHMADGRKQLGSQTYRQHLEELVEAGPDLDRHRQGGARARQACRAGGQAGREAGGPELIPAGGRPPRRRRAGPGPAPGGGHRRG
jgi:twitching motility protein PilT